VVLNDITAPQAPRGRAPRLRRQRLPRAQDAGDVAFKGFAETLLDGALEERDDAARFVRIIRRPGRPASTRSSRTSPQCVGPGDERTRAGPSSVRKASIDDVLHVAAEVCAAKAEAKNIKPSSSRVSAASLA